MTIRTVPRRHGTGMSMCGELEGPLPDPEEFVQMQWYLAQMFVFPMLLFGFLG